MHSNQQDRKTLTLKRESRFQYPAKKKPGSLRLSKHESDLKRIQESGKEINLFLMSGVLMTGRVIAVDKYTIKIDAKLVNGKVKSHTFFKHSIESFSEVE